MSKSAFAIGAHPDDIEFFMAGTLLLLKGAGYAIHYMTIANGSCGTAEYDTDAIVKIRRREAKNAAKAGTAFFHESFVNDIEIFYEKELLKRVTSVIRQVAPEIILTHSPQDYMEDHMNTSRLAVSGAFCRGMRNFPVIPPREPVYEEVAVYHCQPHFNKDPLGRRVQPQFYVNIESVMETKVEMLCEHKSQKDWLDKTQGMDAYQNTLKDLAREAGRMSGCFSVAEGWRKHLYTGLSSKEINPLAPALGDKLLVNKRYKP